MPAASVRVFTNTIRIVITVVREDTNHDETITLNTSGENTNIGRKLIAFLGLPLKKNLSILSILKICVPSSYVNHPRFKH